MSRSSRRILLSASPLALLIVLCAPARPRCGESGASKPDSSGSFRWGGVYSGLIDLKKNAEEFPWNDPSSESHLTDRLSLMFDAGSAGCFHLFVKGATGLSSEKGDTYSSRLFIEQGHISASWRDHLEGKLFLRERIFRNRGRLMLLVSNDSELISRGGEGLAVTVCTAGPAHLTYTGAVFRDPEEQKESGGLPPASAYGDYLNVFEASVRRRAWHLGMTLAGLRSQRLGDSVMYGLDWGFDLGGGRITVEFARSASGRWDNFGGELLGLDFDAMKWGSLSSGLPADGAAAAEWTGFALDGGKKGMFGLTPGYRYSGSEFIDSFGEVPSGHVESYIDMWWKHATLASLVSIRGADRYEYATGKGGGILEASVMTRFRGGLETTTRAFFAEGRRPALLFSTVDDNSLTRLIATARIDDAGGRSEFSFLTEAGVNLGRYWSLGGTIYLERSVRGYYTADLELRRGKRFVFRASAGTYFPSFHYANLNYDPSPPVTEGDRVIALYTRIWLGGI